MKTPWVLMALLAVGRIAGAEDALPKRPAAPIAPAPAAKPLEKPRTPEQAADAVLAAVPAKDDAALKALAAKDDPDPWLVADELVRRREFDSAEAFAKAAPRKDVERLPEYVASRRGLPGDSERRAHLAAANAALAAGASEEALDTLGPPESGAIEDVVGVRLAACRGAAFAALLRAEAPAALLLSAEAAERLGWLLRATQSIDRIGREAFRVSDFTAAQVAFDREIALCELRADRMGAARALGQIGITHVSLGNYARALATFKAAMAAAEAAGDAAGAETVMLNIGVAYQALGDYAKALSVLERALAFAEARTDTAREATAWGNIGNIYARLGDFEKALSAYERAVAKMESLGDKAGEAWVLGNMGNVYSEQGDFKKALSTHERVLAVDQALGDKHGAATALGNIGADQVAMGDFATALSTLERALAATEGLGDKAGAALVLSNIGGVQASLGDHAAALSTLARALAALEAQGDRTGAARTLGTLSNVHFSLGDFAKALASAHRAVLALASVVGGLGDEEGAGAREPLSGVYEAGARASVAAGDASELAFFLESGRAGALLEGLKARETLWSAAVPAELRAAETKARAAEAAAMRGMRHASDAGDRAAIRVRRTELDAARERVSMVIARAQREAKAGAALVYPEAARLDDIRASLADGDVLVLYGMLEKDTYALVVTPTGARIAALGESARIQEGVETLALDDAQSDSAAALATLTRLVVAPLKLPAGTRRLLVSPSGMLGYVPFAALAPDTTVVFVPSGTTYRLLLEGSGRRGEGVLALGDPDYQSQVDERALAVVRGGLRLGQLPGTRAEARALGTQVLLGAEASELGLREALAKRPQWRAVHFACHGLVDPERPASSSLALSSSGDDDGFLTVLEVFQMKIPADLAVLSACQTGKGRIVKGEGIVGLTRAFMFAGAPRVICSLWKVDDEATKALMVKFYELWNPRAQPEDPERAKRVEGAPGSGLPTAEALRKAQEFVRDDPAHPKWKHPYYWAAWVLWGLPN